MAQDRDLTIIAGLDLSGGGAGVERRFGAVTTASGNALPVTIAGAPVVVNINADLADDEVAIGGPDSADTRRLFRGRDDGGGRNVVETVPILLGAQALALGKAEDTAHATGDVGIMALAVRNDGGAALAADGDYIPLTTDATGTLRVTDGAQFAEDSPHGSGDLGTQVLAVRSDAGAALAGTDGDYIPLIVDASGNLWTTIRTIIPGTGPTNLGKSEDAIHASGDTGVMALGVRLDSEDTLVTASGDYEPFHLDGNGRLRTVIGGDRGSFTDGSADLTLGGTSEVVFAANSTRRYLFVQNLSTGDLFLNFGIAAVEDQPSIKLAPDQAFVMEGTFVNTDSVNIIGATTGQAYTAKEA